MNQYVVVQFQDNEFQCAVRRHIILHIVKIIFCLFIWPTIRFVVRHGQFSKGDMTLVILYPSQISNWLYIVICKIKYEASLVGNTIHPVPSKRIGTLSSCTRTPWAYGPHANVCMLCIDCFLMFKHWFCWKYQCNKYIYA